MAAITFLAAVSACLILLQTLCCNQMEKLIVGLWGCFFGLTAVILAGAAGAFYRSLRQIARNAALTASASAFFAVAFLGGLPISDPDAMARFLAHLATLVSALLTYQLFVTLGLLKSDSLRRRAVGTLLGLCLLVLLIGWQLTPFQSLIFSICTACLLAVIALASCLRSAFCGERLAWAATFSVVCILVALAGFGWIAAHRVQNFQQIQALTALAATFYIGTLAYFLWTRYAYLVELHNVMAHGPDYDPVTRMRSNAETGRLVAEVFRSFRERPEPVGVMVVTIANLYALEKLHGSVAVNSAFFVCAGRLRRWVPNSVEMGRLGTDGFLLILRNCADANRWMKLAHSVESRLRRSVALSTSLATGPPEKGNTLWIGEIGVGAMVVANPAVRGSSAISMSRGMSRTAISYPSRIAWFDDASNAIVELWDPASRTGS